MNILLAPDSFKGCLSSAEVCAALTEGIKKVDSNINIMQFPSSDGGEGFCDCMGKIFGGTTVETEVTYPMGDKGKAEYIYNPDEKTAFIELASAAGLSLVRESERDILRASTYGVGELILHAISIGANKVVVGLGGSATNDCGIGLLAALGMEFFDKNGCKLIPYADSLGKVYSVDKNGFINLSNIEIIAACDVKNPLCGADGAAEVFSRQKGASESEVLYLEDSAMNFASVMDIDINGIGYGAAGGAGSALISVLNAKYVSGASLLISSNAFRNALSNADLLITGEGNTDFQSVYGKLVGEVAVAAKSMNVPAIVLSGGLSNGYEAIYNYGVKNCYSLSEINPNINYCIAHAYEMISSKIQDIINDFLK